MNESTSQGTEWLVRVGEAEYRAPSFEMLEQWYREGRLPGTGFVYHHSLGEWKTLSELFDVQPAATPKPSSKKGKFVMLLLTFGMLLALGTCATIGGFLNGSLGSREWKAKRVEAQLRDTDAAIDEAVLSATKIAEKYVGFTVSGEIKDRDENQVAIWGHASPGNGDYTHLGAAMTPANLVILHPHREDIHGMGTFYGSEKLVFFVKKTEGSNAFGASVPVRVFTTEEPSDLQRATDEIRKLNEKREELALKLETLRPRGANGSPAPSPLTDVDGKQTQAEGAPIPQLAAEESLTKTQPVDAEGTPTDAEEAPLSQNDPTAVTPTASAGRASSGASFEQRVTAASSKPSVVNAKFRARTWVRENVSDAAAGTLVLSELDFADGKWFVTGTFDEVRPTNDGASVTSGPSITKRFYLDEKGWVTSVE